MSKAAFRDFIYPLDAPRVSVLHGHDAYSHVTAAFQIPMVAEAFRLGAQLLEAPFKGITTGDEVTAGLYSLKPGGAPVQAMTEAAGRLLDGLAASERQALCYPIDAREWRMWNGTEIYVYEIGLRLEEVSEQVRERILAVMRASLSADVYQTTRHVMWLNGFLGALVAAPKLLNEWSYNFALYGRPSTSEPWGWQLFGHHIALHCFVVGEQMVLSPTFLGAEPNCADEGPYAGVAAFEDHERLGLELMRSLPRELRQQAVVYEQLKDPAMPPGRWDPGDERMMAGAFHDNRVIPYEGARASDFALPARRSLLELVGAYLDPVPSGPQAARMDEIEQHLGDTHFCWIGPVDDVSPFYYRVQSPVVLIEFDQHCGVFLANEEPQRFHVHTIVRTPNGNDYGIDLLRLHYEHAHKRERTDEPHEDPASRRWKEEQDGRVARPRRA